MKVTSKAEARDIFCNLHTSGDSRLLVNAHVPEIRDQKAEDASESDECSGLVEITSWIFIFASVSPPSLCCSFVAFRFCLLYLCRHPLLYLRLCLSFWFVSFSPFISACLCHCLSFSASLSHFTSPPLPLPLPPRSIFPSPPPPPQPRPLVGVRLRWQRGPEDEMRPVCLSLAAQFQLGIAAAGLVGDDGGSLMCQRHLCSGGVLKLRDSLARWFPRGVVDWEGEYLHQTHFILKTDWSGCLWICCRLMNSCFI